MGALNDYAAQSLRNTHIINVLAAGTITFAVNEKAQASAE